MNTLQRIENSLVCVDVDYRDDGARAALLAFSDWGDAAPSEERVTQIADVAPYEPGAFYKRELPCILRVLENVSPRAIIVDGYVWLGLDLGSRSGEAGPPAPRIDRGLDLGSRPGLGARLYEALDRRVPIIGVAKNRFAGAEPIEVLRGGSARPLYVTAAGIDPRDAAMCVGRMHGSHRIPTLLRRVDRLCREK